MSAPPLLKAAGRRRSPVTLPGYLAGRPPRNKGLRYPLDPPTVEEVVAVMRQAVRCAGLDIGVHRSDRRSRAGKLTRQGSPQLRWALYESAQAACRPTSPDRADYLALKTRGLSHATASLTIARKLARRCFHTLRELGPEALEPVT